jgi:hypothetical protein
MRRPGTRGLVVGLVVVAAVAALALVRSHNAKTHVAARVAGAAISTQEVDLLVRHARDEAKREGKEFPQEGTQPYDDLRRQALALLVYHEELAQRARALRIDVPAADLAPPKEAPIATTHDLEAGEDRLFIRQSLRGAALYGLIYDRVTRNVSVGEAEIRAYYAARPEQYRELGVPLATARAQIRRNVVDTKRNALMRDWVARMRRDYAKRVDYADEFRDKNP